MQQIDSLSLLPPKEMVLSNMDRSMMKDNHNASTTTIMNNSVVGMASSPSGTLIPRSPSAVLKEGGTLSDAGKAENAMCAMLNMTPPSCCMLGHEIGEDVMVTRCDGEEVMATIEDHDGTDFVVQFCDMDGYTHHETFRPVDVRKLCPRVQPPEPQGVSLAGQETRANQRSIRVGFININGLTDLKLILICGLIKREGIDVLTLLDTRISKKSIRSLKFLLRDM